MKYLGLFEGIGVFALAARNCGAEIAQLVEIDSFRQQILKKNFPSAQIHSDIKDFSPKGSFDLVCGGFPCSDISASKTSGKGLEGEKSSLWFEMLRVISEAMPTYVVIENVPPTGEGLKNWVRYAKPALAELGYATERLNLSAGGLGACHRREQTFLLAYSNEKRWKSLPKVWQKSPISRVRAKVFTKENPSNNNTISWRLPNGEILRRSDGPSPWMDRYFQQEKPSATDRKRISALGDSIYLPCAEYALNYLFSKTEK